MDFKQKWALYIEPPQKKFTQKIILYMESKVFGDGEYIFGALFVCKAIWGPLEPNPPKKNKFTQKTHYIRNHRFSGGVESIFGVIFVLEAIGDPLEPPKNQIHPKTVLYVES